MMIRKFYCKSCKNITEVDSVERPKEVRCFYCHTKEYMRYASPKFSKQKINWESRCAKIENKLGECKRLLDDRKFQLSFEHNIVAALRKYCTDNEKFYDCLRLAKIQTIKNKKGLYENLKKNNRITDEHDLGFNFGKIRKVRT
jgi:hypothetical protein